jgi:hypothetical protein
MILKNMKDMKDLLITDENVEVDGKTFQNCHFIESRIIFKGGKVPEFTDCIFERCQWVFDGAAENTIQYFAALYTGLGLGGQEIIEGIFDSIRQGGVGHGILEDIPIPASRR